MEQLLFLPRRGGRERGRGGGRSSTREPRGAASLGGASGEGAGPGPAGAHGGCSRDPCPGWLGVGGTGGLVLEPLPFPFPFLLSLAPSGVTRRGLSCPQPPCPGPAPAVSFCGRQLGPGQGTGAALAPAPSPPEALVEPGGGPRRPGRWWARRRGCPGRRTDCQDRWWAGQGSGAHPICSSLGGLFSSTSGGIGEAEGWQRPRPARGLGLRLGVPARGSAGAHSPSWSWNTARSHPARGVSEGLGVVPGQSHQPQLQGFEGGWGALARHRGLGREVVSRAFARWCPQPGCHR